MRSPNPTRLFLAALALALAPGVPRVAAAEDPVAPAVAAEIAARPVELYFEAKLLLRDRVMLQRVAVDQWAGGRLLMQARPFGPGTILELVRPLDDPWTFRWYPTKHEVKLGAAVAVAEPAGDPYGALVGKLTAEATRRYDAWWDADVVEGGALRRPVWQERAERFWSARHSAEKDIKDPLHRDPVYPFYVLGDPAGRLGLVVDADGGVLGDSVTERMSNPWLPDGWRAWQRGERTAGYGYWEAERPAWEPNTYQALAAALLLLSGSPLDGAATASPTAAGGDGYSRAFPDLLRQVTRFFETLNPRFEGRIDWNASPTLRFTVVDHTPGAWTVVGDSGDHPLSNERKVSYRAWRCARYDPATGGLTHDEVQVYAAHKNASIKLWIRVGYRPAS